MASFVVTGGAGFIGSHVVEMLVRLGETVTVFDALRPYAWPDQKLNHSEDYSYRLNLLRNCHLIKQDLTNIDSLTEHLARVRPDVVIHLAANPIVGSAEHAPDECRRDLVDATAALISAVRATGNVQRFVHVSSSMVYGHFSASTTSERHPLNPVNAYGRLKMECEKLVHQGLAEVGIACSVVRPMAVFGPGDFYDRVIPVFCRQASEDLPLTIRASADMSIDFTYVTDVADGIVRAASLTGSMSETFNLAFGEAHSLLEVAAILRNHFPALRYEVIKEASESRPSRGALDITKARRLLGYRPRVCLEEGIALYLRRLRTREGVANAQVKPQAAMLG